MAMANVDSNSLLVDSQAKSVGLFRGLMATWYSVSIHQINWVNCHCGFTIILVLLLLFLPRLRQTLDCCG